MSGPSDKHMQAAKEVIDARIDSMCLTWDHSFGLMDDAGKDHLRRCFRQIAFHDIIPFVATALATAEQEGMRRAAEIAREGAALRRAQSKDEFQFNKFERRDFDSMAIACHQVATAILSEAKSHSPDTSPVEADQATGAVSSSPAPVAVSYPWRGRGFNPDSVG